MDGSASLEMYGNVKVFPLRFLQSDVRYFAVECA